MLILNIETVPSENVEEYFGIVDTQIVIGVNLFRDIFASFRDVFGGQTKSYQKELDKLKKIAYDTITTKAKNVGANAVIGVKTDLEELSGQGKSMFMLSMQGTAVKMDEDFYKKTKQGNKLDGFLINNEELTTKIGLYNEMNIALNSEKPYFTSSQKIEKFTNESFWNDRLAIRLFNDCLGGAMHAFNLEKTFLDACKQIKNSTILKYLDDIIENISTKELVQFKKILIVNNIYDLEALLKYLGSDDYKIRYKALLLALPIMEFYKKSNILDFEKVLEFMKNDFVTIEKELESNNEEKFSCINCGNPRKLEYPCSSCSIVFKSGSIPFKFGQHSHEVSVPYLMNLLKVTNNTLSLLFE